MNTTHELIRFTLVWTVIILFLFVAIFRLAEITNNDVENQQCSEITRQCYNTAQERDLQQERHITMIETYGSDWFTKQQ